MTSSRFQICLAHQTSIHPYQRKATFTPPFSTPIPLLHTRRNNATPSHHLPPQTFPLQIHPPNYFPHPPPTTLLHPPYHPHPHKPHFRPYPATHRPPHPDHALRRRQPPPHNLLVRKMVFDLRNRCASDTPDAAGRESWRSGGRAGICGSRNGFEFDWGFTCYLSGTYEEVEGKGGKGMRGRG